jgi:hypothetical protein
LPIGVLAARLLGAHVRGRAARGFYLGVRGHRRLTAAGSWYAFRESEVEHLDEAVARERDIVGLQVAVDDAAIVRSFDRAGNLQRDLQSGLDAQRSSVQPIRERLAVDELEHQHLAAVVVFDAVNRGDVRMINSRNDGRFPLEPCDSPGVGREIGRQCLQRDVAFQLRIASAIDLAHSAAADDGEHFVVRYARAGLHV